ncbi:MAG: TPM domain-containing protein [Deltaproteobacteria bacterium]|jgi:putative membrane protein|nr:TPM domain-containing protein [Deltaproteobacteria bacterium]
MTGKKADIFFSESEKQQISTLVKKAESETSGEIAAMVVDESDSYREANILGATLLSAFVALVVVVSIHHVTVWSYIPAVIIFWTPALYFMRAFPRFKLALAGKKRLEEAVRERAVRAFFEKGLYRTKGETGILIFISILEHKVWILGDRGINQRIDPQFWQTLAGELAGSIRENQAFGGLCTAIDKLGNVLKEHFPRAADDTNELSDKVIF